MLSKKRASEWGLRASDRSPYLNNRQGPPKNKKTCDRYLGFAGVLIFQRGKAATSGFQGSREEGLGGVGATDQKSGNCSRLATFPSCRLVLCMRKRERVEKRGDDLEKRDEAVLKVHRLREATCRESRRLPRLQTMGRGIARREGDQKKTKALFCKVGAFYQRRGFRHRQPDLGGGERHKGGG